MPLSIGARATAATVSSIGLRINSLQQIPMPMGAVRTLLPLLVSAALASVGCSSRQEGWAYRGQFRDAVRESDRIVVRDGGLNGPLPLDRQKVLFQVTNPAEIREVIENLQFQPQQSAPSCACWGYPGIAWYRGRQCLAVTSVQHCRAIRWKDFPTDAVLTKESAAWLKQWLLRHSFKEEKLK
jgi:hypothetical protein